MAANPSVSKLPSTDADRVCVHCGKVVDPDRERLCNHCGLPFRGGPDAGQAGPAIEEPGVAGRQLLKIAATLAFVVPPLGPLSSLSSDPGTLLGFFLVVIAGGAALVFAWRRPLPGGILVALAGTVPFIVELIVDATGGADPASRYWLFWLFPGGLVGGALFLAAAFWRAPEPSEPGAEREGAPGPRRISLVERVRREAVGLAVLVVVGLVFSFVAVAASYPAQPGQTFAVPGWLLVGWPLLLVGAGVLGHREDRARGAFLAGLAGAVVAIAGILIPPIVTGHEAIQAAPGEGIVEVWLAVGLMIVGGGFFGLLGGGITALIGSLPRRVGHP